jgi:hypothetical protein
MRALVAVSFSGRNSVILRHWPESTNPESPWGCEFEAVGSERPEDLGLVTPKESGLWIWEGNLYYCGPNAEGVCDDGPEWRGNWRRKGEVGS